MYAYTYFDKRKKRLLVVDWYDYADTPIAQVTVFQCRNKMTDRMNLPPEGNWYGFYEKNKFKMVQPHVEFWSHLIDHRRSRAFENYRLGQKQ